MIILEIKGVFNTKRSNRIRQKDEANAEKDNEGTIVCLIQYLHNAHELTKDC